MAEEGQDWTPPSSPEAAASYITEDDAKQLIAAALQSYNLPSSFSNIQGTSQLKQIIYLNAGQEISAAGKPIFQAPDGKGYIAHALASSVTDRYLGLSAQSVQRGGQFAVQRTGKTEGPSGLTEGSLYYLQDPATDQSQTSDNSGDSAYGANWLAQTFTAGVSAPIVGILLEVARNGSPGTVTVSIRATDGSGHPTGSDLTSATFNGNDLPTTAADYNVVFTTPYLLTSGVKYAIVIRATGGSVGNSVDPRSNTGGGYGSGNEETSADSGATWSASSSDLHFKTYYVNTTLGTTPGTVSVKVGIAQGSAGVNML